ncbi:MAG: hypothetical protein KAU35_06845 [candidate division Zixibacteria bacterium]|nr:hypothetical protein [candidate division Zixibacteria bacterium]
MRPKLVLQVVPLLLVAVLIAGCNIFSWTSGESTESLIDAGRSHMHDAEYELAQQKFAEAMEEDPTNSDARYYHAKATMRVYGFDALTLGLDLSEGDFADGDGLPFSGDNWSKEKANRLFQAMKIVYDDLRPIYFRQTNGGYDSSDIDLDLGLVAAIKGILFFRDTNFDGLITDLDFDLIFEFGESQSGFSIMNMMDYAAQGPPGAARDRTQLAAAPQPVDPDLAVAFNTMIDNIEDIIQESMDIILAIFAENDPALDPDEIEDVLDEIIEIVRMYKIDDGGDNDGDGYIDEEIIDGLDNDGDGWIDEDSNGYYDLNPGG